MYQREDLIYLELQGEQCLIGYFNMGEKRVDNIGPSSTLYGYERNQWCRITKWAFQDVINLGTWVNKQLLAYVSL